MSSAVSPSIASTAELPAPAVANRTRELSRQQFDILSRRVDRSFAALMVCQYVACLLVSLLISPHAWPNSEMAGNVWAAVLLGGVITAIPVALSILHPGEKITRHGIAAAQMLMSGLLIHLTGGRLETHFHVFGSLAFLAFYRDWRVLVTASAVVIVDHLLRALWWPESIFGASTPEPWRWVEHTGWLIFEVACLIVAIRQNLATFGSLMENRAELELARDRAEQASNAKDDFMAVLSHELRTPLTPSLMMLSSLAEDERIEPALRKDIALVRRNVELEARLIDDLLDLTRVVAGKLQLTPGNVDLHALLGDLLETCRNEFQAKRLTVRRTFEAQRPWLYGDSARVQQVFWNLLKNAVKFTPAGGQIEVRTSDAGEKIRIDVTDNGVGIPAEVLPRIFQRFEQGGVAVTREFGGLGLGLTICRAIVDMHRGAIRAESRGPGWGATFTVVFPARQSAPTQRAGVQTQLLRLNGLLPRRVLLVDDHTDTRETLARLLAKANYEVTTADTVASALDKAATAKYDIVVSDIGLPDGSGCDLMRELKQRYGMRGVAFSGYGMEEDIRKSLEAGFSAHLTKPVDFHRLKEVMGLALQNKPAQAAA